LFRVGKIKKGLIYFLTISLAFSHLAYFLVQSPKAYAMDDPNFDFSKQTFELVIDNGKRLIKHTVPYTEGGQTKTYTKTYEFMMKGTFAQKYSGVGGLNVYKKTGEIYRLGDDMTYSLAVAQDPPGSDTYKVIGFFYNAALNQGETCDYWEPNMGFWGTDNINVAPRYCLKNAIGGTDTIFTWYVKKLYENLAQQWQNGSSPTVTTKPIQTIQDCQKLFLSGPQKDKIDQIFKEMDPNNILGYGGKSPLSEAEDKELYEKFYKSDMVTDYSDRHFLTDSGYRIFTDQYQAAEEGLASYWTDISQKDKVANTTEAVTLSGAAASKGIQIVGSAVAKLALKVPSAPGAGAVFDAGVATSEFAAASFWPLVIIAGTVYGAKEGIAAYKGNENAKAREQLAKLIHVAFYVPAHIQYHECMMNNNSKDFTKKDYEEEVKNWSMAFKLILGEVDKFIEAEKQAQSGNEEACGVSFLSGGLSQVFFNALAGALCAAINAIANATQWIVDHLYGDIFNASLYNLRYG